MRIQFSNIMFVSILLMVFGVFAGCGGDDEQSAVDQPKRAEELVRKDELREYPREGKIQREDIQDERQVMQERVAEMQNPEAEIPMPAGAPEQKAGREPRTPQGQRELAGAGRTVTGGDSETLQIDADLIGKQVVSEDGEKLGKVTDIYRGAEGNADYVLVQSVDRRLYPVPMRLLTQGARGMGLELAIDRQTFKKAPSMQEPEKERLYEPEFDRKVRSYYRKSSGGEDAY